MSVWAGFGVNYNGTQSDWTKHLAYFKAIGATHIRPTMPQYGYPYDSTKNTLWRNCAQTFLNAGFYVTWGITSSGASSLTSSTWPNYHDSVVAEAAYLQSQGIIFSDFELGNELDMSIDGTTITQVQLYTNVQQLALDVKAVYSGRISYALSGAYSVWQASWQGGLGHLDVISVHPYGNINVNAQTVSFGNVNNILSYMPTYYGTNWYVSEFNLDASNANLQALSQAASVTNMQTMFNSITASGTSTALVYKWNQGVDVTLNNFAGGLLSGGAMNSTWPTFFTSQPMYYTSRLNAASRTSVPNRTAVPTRTNVPNRTLIFS